MAGRKPIQWFEANRISYANGKSKTYKTGWCSRLANGHCRILIQRGVKGKRPSARFKHPAANGFISNALPVLSRPRY
jgi:hypothetical protein